MEEDPTPPCERRDTYTECMIYLILKLASKKILNVHCGEPMCEIVDLFKNVMKLCMPLTLLNNVLYKNFVSIRLNLNIYIFRLVYIILVTNLCNARESYCV